MSEWVEDLQKAAEALHTARGIVEAPDVHLPREVVVELERAQQHLVRVLGILAREVRE